MAISIAYEVPDWGPWPHSQGPRAVMGLGVVEYRGLSIGRRAPRDSFRSHRVVA